jgi:coenzyme F420-reducing hydrogenase alpha subunit
MIHQTPRHVAAPGSVPETPKQTVFDLVSLAQGWHERAVILRALAHDVARLFGGEHAELLVKRLSGAARLASEGQIAAVASELRDAAVAAQEESERILGTALEPVDEGRVRGLGGRWARLVRSSALELEDLDECAVPRVETPHRPGPAVVLPARRMRWQ